MASPSTWSRVIWELGLKEDRIRIYPSKPKVGIRASAPGQIWHLDQTILRLGDGTKAFVQCIIDNYSRYVLAWKVSRDYGGARTKELIEQALAKARSLGLHMKPNVLVESGCENINEKVDFLVDSGSILMMIAQIDIEQSNSMVEMLFHRMKHRYLFTILLSNFDSLVKGADFFLIESNTCIPHSALKGATPEEIITGSLTAEKKMELKEKIKNVLATYGNYSTNSCPRNENSHVYQTNRMNWRRGKYFRKWLDFPTFLRMYTKACIPYRWLTPLAQAEQYIKSKFGPKKLRSAPYRY